MTNLGTYENAHVQLLHTAEHSTYLEACRSVSKAKEQLEQAIVRRAAARESLEATPEYSLYLNAMPPKAEDRQQSENLLK